MFPAWLPWVLLITALGFGATRLRFETDVLGLLPRDMDVVRGLQLYERHFTDSRELILTIEAPTAPMAESAARELAMRLQARTQEVSRVVWQPGLTGDPEQAAELLGFLWLNQPPEEVATLAARLEPGKLAAVLDDSRQQLATTLSPFELASAAHDPLGLLRLPGSMLGGTHSLRGGEEFFASADGTFRVVFVQSRNALGDYRACRDWLASVRRLVDDAARTGAIQPEARIGYTGRPAFVAEISQSMENDMAGSCSGTLATIALLFWLAHRRVRPLIWLLAVLLMTTAGTLALGGLFLGTLNIVSLGFAAILLGLAEDFGILIYQESRSHPALDARALRRKVAPGILWSALTTSGAFLTLALSRLPGLAQLGTLVALGIALAAVIMLFGYTPVLLRLRRPRDRHAADTTSERFLLFQTPTVMQGSWARWLTIALAVMAVALLWVKGISIDRSPEAFEPRHNAARAALNRVQAMLTQQSDPTWMIVQGGDATQAGDRLDRIAAVLRKAQASGEIAGFDVPVALWPRPQWQAANRPLLQALAARRAEFESAAQTAGFTGESMELSRGIMAVWRKIESVHGPALPGGTANRWMLEKFSAHSPEGWLALGAIRLDDPGSLNAAQPPAWLRDVRKAGGIVSGWDLLGSAVFDAARLDLRWMVGLVCVLVILTLWLAFRSWRDVALSVGTLGFGALILGAIMGWMGWSWNLMNLVALPLLLGMGVDFSIHMQMSLRDHEGDSLEVRRSTGRALLLAGSTTVAGFASLAFSSNSGMASLGRTCALGISIALLTAVYLLPAWWNVGKAVPPAPPQP